jgi:hypothetical protein
MLDWWFHSGFADRIAVAGLAISILSLLFSVVTAVFMAIMTVLGLRFAAKPRIRIGMKLSTGKKLEMTAGEEATISFHMKNVGRFYAKPAANGVRLYLNFDPSFEVLRARYGSALQLTESEVHRGKENSKYLKVAGIQLFYGESGEDVQVDLKAPSSPNTYKVWVAALCDNCDLGIHRFEITVIEVSNKN